MTITKYTSDKDGVYTQLFYFYLIAIALCVLIYIFMGNGQLNNPNFDSTTKFIFREWFSNIEYTWKFILFFGFAAAWKQSKPARHHTRRENPLSPARLARPSPPTLLPICVCAARSSLPNTASGGRPHIAIPQATTLTYVAQQYLP